MRQLTAKSLLFIFNCTVIFLRVTFQSHDFKLLSVTFQSSPLNQVFLFQSFLVHACIFPSICFFLQLYSKKNSKSQFAIIRFDQLAMPWICNGIPDHVVKSEWQNWKDPVSGVHELWQKVTWYSGWKDWKLGSIKQCLC